MISLKKIERKVIYIFSIEGKINEEDIHKFYTLLEEKVAKHEKIKLLGIMNEFPHSDDFKSIGEAMKVKMTGKKGIAKYAILTDKSWVENVVPVGNFVTPGLPIKAFKLNEKAKAIAWLENENKSAKQHMADAPSQHATPLPNKIFGNLALTAFFTIMAVPVIYAAVQAIDNNTST